MKKNLLLVLVGILSMIGTGFGQISAGVSPGLNMNSAYLGYQVNEKLVPFVGFQKLSLNGAYTYERYVLQDDYTYHQEKSTESFRGNIYLPYAGLKYFFIQQDKLKAYGSAMIAIPVAWGKIEYENTKDIDPFEGMKAYGASLGFGAEYFLDEHFSLGGEFGIRYFHYKQTTTEEATEYNPHEATNEISLNISPTYNKISLNFYFNKKAKK